MAEQKPLGVEKPKVTSATPPPGQKPGVTGFPQEYNTDPPPTNDLNPDVTTPTPEPPPQERERREDRPDDDREPRPDHPAPR